MKTALSALAGAALATLIGSFVLQGGLATDFIVLWAAHQIPNPYDVVELRSAIGTVIEPPATDWPYPYPPTFLLLTSWFKLLPLGAAYLVWLSLTGGALVASARHPAAPLLLLSPWVIYALMAGQTSVALGALILGGLSLLNKPVLAGALLGLAACIKPQFLLFVGVGLLFAKEWRAIWALLISGAGLVLTSIAAYGLEIWQAWFDLMPRMLVYTQQVGSHLDLPGWPLKLIAFPIGLILIWPAFRNGSADEKAIVACGTSLLCLPHSLWYNSAMMAPAILSAARRWPAILLLPTLLLRPSTMLIALVTPALAVLGRLGSISDFRKTNPAPSA